MVTGIYLVRHAEAEGNAQEFFQGSIDTALTKKGRRQLDFLAERFRDIPLDAIYTSPFRRAKQTAEAVNRYHGLPLTEEYRLREIDAGAWEHQKWADLPKLFPHAYEMWTEHMDLFCAPSGDAMCQVYARMRDILTEIARANAGKTVAVCSHGCALRNFLSYVEFGTITRLHEVGWADNTAVSCAEYDGDAWHLIFKNDASHLPETLSTLRTSRWARYETEPDA